MGGGWGVVGFFFFTDTATTEIYTLSLHDALPISKGIWTDRGCASDACVNPTQDSLDT